MSKINPSLSGSFLSDSSQKVADFDAQKTPTKESTKKNKNKNNSTLVPETRQTKNKDQNKPNQSSQSPPTGTLKKIKAFAQPC
jgi:hypothetical protein